MKNTFIIFNSATLEGYVVYTGLLLRTEDNDKENTEPSTGAYIPVRLHRAIPNSESLKIGSDIELLSNALFANEESSRPIKFATKKTAAEGHD